jgi:hypothetical protein
MLLLSQDQILTPKRKKIMKNNLQVSTLKKIRVSLMAVTAATLLTTSVVSNAANTYADESGLPDPGFKVMMGKTALVITDPQNDFLSPDGVTWGVVGKNVTENGTVQNLDDLFAAAKSVDLPVFVSPHYYYEHDHQWKFEGALEVLMHKIGMFDRKGALSTDGFEGSGADWLPQYKKYINDGCLTSALMGPNSRI